MALINTPQGEGRVIERDPSYYLAAAEDRAKAKARMDAEAKAVTDRNAYREEQLLYSKDGGKTYDVNAMIEARRSTANWAAQAPDRAAGAQRAIEAQPGYAAAHAANLAAIEKNQKDSMSKAALDLNLALDAQNQARAKRQGRAGTFSSGPLGIPMGVFDTQTIGGGGKTLLGQ